MDTYEFTIVATGLRTDDEEWQEVFFEAGCDDASPALVRGVFVLRFDREAANLEEAVRSAVADVRRAGAEVRRVEPEPLVSASEIAERAGLSRQLVSLYVKGERSQGFPPPAAGASTQKPLWRWAEVAAWLATAGKLDDQVAEQAATIEMINDEIARGGSKIGDETLALVASDDALSRYARVEHYEGEIRRTQADRPARFRTPVRRDQARDSTFLFPTVANI